nr:hypothetical protein [uncultured Chryseobacterium sp.]
MEEKIQLDFKKILDFEYEKIKNNILDYHFVLILLIYIVLKFKNVKNIKHIVLTLINERIANCSGQAFNDNLFINVINELSIDFDPDGKWSKFSNIWEEDINCIDKYMDKMQFREKEGFY